MKPKNYKLFNHFFSHRSQSLNYCMFLLFIKNSNLFLHHILVSKFYNPLSICSSLFFSFLFFFVFSPYIFLMILDLGFLVFKLYCLVTNLGFLFLFGSWYELEFFILHVFYFLLNLLQE
jgi:hypothetical protein